MNYKIKELKQNTDERGTLIEVLRSDEVGTFNQVYSATIKPGCVRGGHYHKERKEWFCVLKGSGVYHIRDLITDDIADIYIREGEYKQIELKPGIYHEIRNTGDTEMVFVSVISDLYDKNNSDTFKI